MVNRRLGFKLERESVGAKGDEWLRSDRCAHTARFAKGSSEHVVTQHTFSSASAD